VTLEGLKRLGQLKQLDLRWNKLTKAREDTAVLRKHTPALLRLDTRYNPWNRVRAVFKNKSNKTSCRFKIEGFIVMCTLATV